MVPLTDAIIFQLCQCPFFINFSYFLAPPHIELVMDYRIVHCLLRGFHTVNLVWYQKKAWLDWCQPSLVPAKPSFGTPNDKGLKTHFSLTRLSCIIHLNAFEDLGNLESGGSNTVTLNIIHATSCISIFNINVMSFHFSIKLRNLYSQNLLKGDWLWIKPQIATTGYLARCPKGDRHITKFQQAPTGAQPKIQMNKSSIGKACSLKVRVAISNFYFNSKTIESTCQVTGLPKSIFQNFRFPTRGLTSC